MIRRDSKAESFQRQIATLREQFASEGDDEPFEDDAEPMPPEHTPAILTAAASGAYASVSARPPLSVSEPWPQPEAATNVVAAGATWNGELRLEGPLHVYGIITGQIETDGDIYVAEGAHVDALVQATNLYVGGLVTGTIECLLRLEVRPSGRVDGDVTAGTLVVHDGATLTGKLQMRREASADEPTS